MENEYLTINEVLNSLGDKAQHFSDLVSRSKLRPCFRCIMTLVDSVNQPDLLGQIDYEHPTTGYFPISGYITPSAQMNMKIAQLLDSQEDKSFYLRAAKAVEILQTNRNYFLDDDSVILSEFDQTKLYSIDSNHDDYEEDKGVKFRISQCQFLRSDLEMLLPKSPETIFLTEGETPTTQELKINTGEIAPQPPELIEPIVQQLSSSLQSATPIRTKRALCKYVRDKILEAFKETKYDPLAYPVLAKGEEGVKYEIKQILNKDNEMMALFKKDENFFDNRWKDLRIAGRLKSTEDV